jgi:hypothetical protein
MQGLGGTSRLDLALTTAFEQGADAIFVITDGVPRIIKSQQVDDSGRANHAPPTVTDNQLRDHERQMEFYQKELAKWNKKQDKRIKKGEGPSISEEGGTGAPTPPTHPANQGGYQPTVTVAYWTTDDILAHINLLQKTQYTGKGKGKAAVHVVSYEADGVTRKFLRKLARNNQGKYRSIRGM